MNKKLLFAFILSIIFFSTFPLARIFAYTPPSLAINENLKECKYFSYKSYYKLPEGWSTHKFTDPNYYHPEYFIAACDSLNYKYTGELQLVREEGITALIFSSNTFVFILLLIFLLIFIFFILRKKKRKTIGDYVVLAIEILGALFLFCLLSFIFLNFFRQ